MADEITFGIRITANNDQLVSTVAESTAAINSLGAATQTAQGSNNSLNDTIVRQTALMSNTAGEMRQRTAEQLNSSSAITKLLDQYDQQGARLRRLQADFTALDKAAISGVIGTNDDTRLDKVYSILQQEIKAASIAMLSHTTATQVAGTAAVGHAVATDIDTVAVKTNSRAVTESLVLMREAARGNFSKMAGSASIMAQALGYLPAILSTVGLSIISVTAAIIGIGAAMAKGYLEQKKMDDALIMTGNYAGKTSSQLDSMAHAATSAGGSIGDAKKAVIELTNSGKFTGDQIEKITGAVVAMENATGISIEKTIKQFESLAVQSTGSARRASVAISNATLKLDDEYHYLTLAVYEQITALEKEGRAKDASRLATDEFARVTRQRSEEIISNLGYVEKAWKGVKESIGGAISAMGDWGKKSTAQSEVDRLGKQLGYALVNNGKSDNTFDQENLKKLKSEYAYAQQQLQMVNSEAASAGEKSVAQSKAIHAAQRINIQNMTLEKKSQNELTEALKAYRQEVADIRAVDKNDPLVSDKVVSETEEAIRRAHTPIAKHEKADPVINWEKSKIKEAINLLEEAAGKTDNLTRAQINLRETMKDSLWEKATKQWRDDYTHKMNSASAAEINQVITKKSNDAQAESIKIIEKIHVADAAAIEELQFKNSLIGKSILEVQQLTEAHKIELDIKKQLQELDNNSKFATRDKGDGKPSNPMVTAAWSADSEEIKKSGEAAKAAAEVEIAARYAANRSWDTQGVKAINDYMDNVNNAGRQSAQLFSSIFKGAEDTLTKFYQTGKLGARDFVNMISGELARLTAQKTMSSLGNLFGNTGIGESGIVSAVSHFFGFADGGIMTSAGPMPLKAYSNGGVANSPQLTLFGEGRTPEAFVPLPDGRSIPVSLTTTGSSSNRSTTQGDININIIMNTATGTTQSSGATSSPNLSQLSAGIAQTVRQVIVNEQRQGGLLAIGAK